MENEKTPILVKLRFLFDVLLFGSAWGLLEATLGTLLHLPMFDKAGMYAASSTIMVPIAYYLMANCYKRTGKLYALPIMGVIAALIKLTVAFVIGFRPSVYNPAIYIVVESLAMMGGLAVFRPTNVLSLKTLGAVILANTTYQFSYLMINWANGGTNVFASQKAWMTVGEKYLFTFNCVAILYCFASGALFYGLFKLLERLHVEVKIDYKKFVYSPITAAAVFTVAVALTITFAAVL